jgi:hypothetical protein
VVAFLVYFCVPTHPSTPPMFRNALSLNLLSPLECTDPSVKSGHTKIVSATPLECAALNRRLANPCRMCRSKKGGGGWRRVRQRSLPGPTQRSASIFAGPRSSSGHSFSFVATVWQLLHCVRARLQPCRTDQINKASAAEGSAFELPYQARFPRFTTLLLLIGYNPHSLILCNH